MFSDWLTQAVFNDDERDTTEVTKKNFERGFRLCFYFFITVSSLHLVSLINSLPNLYIIM